MTNTYGSQFGGTGAAINAVSKSGTNDLHGSVYEYMRNSAMDATNYFDVPGEKPSFKRNQFGGTLGGPIKKDKAFYFINYEGLRAGQGQTARAVVPVTDNNPTDYTFFEDNGMVPNGEGGWVGSGASIRRYGRADALGDSADIRLASGFPKRDAMPQCNRHHSSNRRGALLLGWDSYPERGLRAGPRRLHYRIQGQPVRTLRHRECLSKRPLFDKYILDRRSGISGNRQRTKSVHHHRREAHFFAEDTQRSPFGVGAA